MTQSRFLRSSVLCMTLAFSVLPLSSPADELTPAPSAASLAAPTAASLAALLAGPGDGLTPWTYEPDSANARLGTAVATAGDVNGDGYSDLLVGAPFFTNGQAAEGRVFLFHGSPVGLSTTPDWVSESNSVNALYGVAVSAAGDVNGDGFGDVVIGAPWLTNGQANEGRVYVFHGSATGLGATPALTIESDQAGAAFGWSVGIAGDVNGDGFADVIVGAPLFDNGQTDEGRAFVYHGSASGLATTPAWSAESNQASGELGFSVGTAGDVNGDGFADVIAGAEHFDNGQTDEGRAFVYHGSASGLALTAAWITESDQARANFGASVAGAGDVNGDGYADVIIGAPLYDEVLTDEGRAFVYHGSASGLATTAAWSAGPTQEDAEWGTSVATAGDFNADGYADVIIGAPRFGGLVAQTGAFFVFTGAAGGLRDFSVLPIAAEQTDSRFGCAVGTAGDVDGDGASDVAIGANLFDNGQTDEGRVSVYTGRMGGLAPNATWSADGGAAAVELGTSVATAGDVNGDGYSDIIAGAPGFDNGQTDEGRVVVFHGSATGLAAAPAWSAESNLANEHFGWSVAGAGDVNGDGYADVIVGTFDSDDGNQERAYVYHGGPGGLAAAPAWTGAVGQSNAGFGTAVASAGDVNGDGFADVIVGAPRFDNGQTDEGRAFVFAGSGGGLAASPLWTAESNQALSQFGAAVSGAGDVNGDGFTDVIVGAPAFTNGETAEGRAFVYAGAASGPGAAPLWTGEGNQANASFGCAVAAAGDVNGDGYSDIAAGAKDYDATVANAGRVVVHAGSPAGPSGAAFAVVEGNMLDGRLGRALGTAGDTNGDGLSEVIVGAVRYFHDEDTYGAAVFMGSTLGLDLFPIWVGGAGRNASAYGAAVAGAGDVDGDGFADVMAGEPGFDGAQPDQGRVHVHGAWNDGLARIPRQARTNDAAPIAIRGSSDSPSAFLLKVLGRTPAGRGRVRLQHEVKPAGVPFDGSGLVAGVWAATSAPGTGGSTVPLTLLASSLAPGTLHHWRLRIVTDSPYFPPSRWLWAPDNAVTEADVRTSGTTTGVDVAAAPPRAARLVPGAPNPFSASTEMAFELPAAGPVTLGVYDVSGRKVASLVNGVRTAGSHVVEWDGRDVAGRVLPAGVYFVRLELPGGQRTAGKVVIAR